MTGLGMFIEGFTLFSIGNLAALFNAWVFSCFLSHLCVDLNHPESVWPHCWKTHQVCNKQWVYSVDYLEIIGIICGQILVGFEGDWIGRRFGLVQDAIIMSLGTVMLIAAWGNSLEGWVICYAWSLWVYGTLNASRMSRYSTPLMIVTSQVWVWEANTL